MANVKSLLSSFENKTQEQSNKPRPPIQQKPKGIYVKHSALEKDPKRQSQSQEKDGKSPVLLKPFKGVHDKDSQNETQSMVQKTAKQPKHIESTIDNTQKTNTLQVNNELTKDLIKVYFEGYLLPNKITNKYGQTMYLQPFPVVTDPPPDLPPPLVTPQEMEAEEDYEDVTEVQHILGQRHMEMQQNQANELDLPEDYYGNCSEFGNDVTAEEIYEEFDDCRS